MKKQLKHSETMKTCQKRQKISEKQLKTTKSCQRILKMSQKLPSIIKSGHKRLQNSQNGQTYEKLSKIIKD